MSGDARFRYRDRRTGAIREDAIYARGFLDWLHNTPLGQRLTTLLASRRLVSWGYGWWNRRGWTRRKIAPFVRAMGVAIEESAEAPERFRCFNDLIIRRIDLARRPVDPDPAVCTAPADARVRVFPTIDRETEIALKGAAFRLESLLGDPALAAAYAGGSLYVGRLYLADYHHFHFPDSGCPDAARRLAGRYYATSPYARAGTVPYLAANHRHVTRLDSDHFGPVAMVEVGAFAVGGIRQCYAPGSHVAKGAHKGYFELGASVVVLCFAPGRIEFDADLVAAGGDGLETYVRLGESIGRAVR